MTQIALPKIDRSIVSRKDEIVKSLSRLTNSEKCPKSCR
jgi:glycolate oxidase